MSEEKPRKTLSLKKNNTIKSPVKTRKKPISKDYLEKMAEHNPEFAKLYEKRQKLINQIQQVEQRLKFAASGPLKCYCLELKMQDMRLLCQMNDYLVAQV